MGKDSKISWCDHTFSPWWGCTKVAAGCKHCYAEGMAARFGTQWGIESERRFFGDKHWREPLAWNRAAEKAGVRARVFCSSLADVFEDRRDLDEHRVRLWSLIEATPWLDWLLLTKRPENMSKMLAHWLRTPRSNVWIGTSICTQEDADKNIPELLRTPVALRFLSVEPLLEEITLPRDGMANLCGCGKQSEPCDDWYTTGCRNYNRLSWIIAGGESGPHARTCNVEWIRSIVRQCREAGVACWVKQMGANPVEELSTPLGRAVFAAMELRDRAGADPSEWEADLQVRQMPK